LCFKAGYRIVFSRTALPDSEPAYAEYKKQQNCLCSAMTQIPNKAKTDLILIGVDLLLTSLN
jgi:hypothetical protein